MFFCATKEPKAPGVRYLPDPEPLGARPQDPMQTKLLGFAGFIASRRGKGKLNSECNAFGIYRSDAYAAATYLFAFYGFGEI